MLGQQALLDVTVILAVTWPGKRATFTRTCTNQKLWESITHHGSGCMLLLHAGNFTKPWICWTDLGLELTKSV
jgi:hypothetical protein